jgi:hypothetical protein
MHDAETTFQSHKIALQGSSTSYTVKKIMQNTIYGEISTSAAYGIPHIYSNTAA